MARKTVYITELINKANKMIASNRDHAPENQAGRMAIGGFLESVLHDNGVYAGYGYLMSEWSDDGKMRLKEDFDESARVYSVHKLLKGN